MHKILISTSSFGESDPEPLKLIKKHGDILMNPYGRQLTTDEFIELAEGCDAVIAGTEKITAEALGKLPRLKVISRCGAGTDNVDIAAAKKLGIKFFYTPDAPAPAVAEFTIASILNALRKISEMDTLMHDGVWKKQTGRLLSGKNTAVIGLGRIGKRVAGLLVAFGANVRYNDVVCKNSEYEYEPDLLALLGWADIITLHCAAEKDAPLIGKREFQAMKEGAILVNTSRGSIVDESALIEAMSEDSSKRAAIDVYPQEPYSGELIKLKNVILTPHVASAAEETRAAMEMEAAQNCLRGLGLA